MYRIMNKIFRYSFDITNLWMPKCDSSNEMGNSDIAIQYKWVLFTLKGERKRKRMSAGMFRTIMSILNMCCTMRYPRVPLYPVSVVVVVVVLAYFSSDYEFLWLYFNNYGIITTEMECLNLVYECEHDLYARERKLYGCDRIGYYQIVRLSVSRVSFLVYVM